MTDLDILLEKKTEKMPEPPKAWRNRWLVNEACELECSICHTIHEKEAGDEFLSCWTWPTETKARAEASECIKHWLKYLGPIPVPV